MIKGKYWKIINCGSPADVLRLLNVPPIVVELLPDNEDFTLHLANSKSYYITYDESWLWGWFAVEPTFEFILANDMISKIKYVYQGTINLRKEKLKLLSTVVL